MVGDHDTGGGPLAVRRPGSTSPTEAIAAIPTPAVVMDGDGRVRAANEPFLRLAGVSLEELHAARGHAGWWDNDTALTAVVRRVTAGQVSERLEGTVLGADGRAAPTRLEVGPFDAGGESLAICVLVDRGAEHRLERRLRAAVDGHVDGLMVFTLHSSASDGTPSDATLADANPRAADMLGLRLGAALGRPLSVLTDPESGEAILGLFERTLRSGLTTEDTRRIHPPGGGRMWVHMRATPLGRDEVVVTVRDITGERTLESVVDGTLDQVGRPVVVSRLVAAVHGDAVDVEVRHLDPHAAIVLGLARDGVRRPLLSRLLDPDSLARLVVLHRSVLAAGAAREVSDYPLDALGGAGGRWSLIPAGDDTVISVRLAGAGSGDAGEAADVRSVMAASLDSMVVGRLERDGAGTPVDAHIDQAHLAGTGARADAGSVRGNRLSALVTAESLADLLTDIATAVTTRSAVEGMHHIGVHGSASGVHRYAVRCVPLGGDHFAASWRDLTHDEAEAYRLRRAIEGGLDGFQIVEMVRDATGAIVDGVVVEANERIASEMGTTRAQYLRTRLSQVSDGPGVARTISEYEQVLRDRRPLEREWPFTLSDGEMRWIRYQMLPLDDAVVVMSRDVTDRRRGEEELRRMAEQMSFVARHSSETISLHARDGRFQFASDGSRRVWGREPGELLGRSGLDFVHPDDRPEVAGVMRRIEQNRDQEHGVTMRVVRPDGSDAWLDTSIRAIRDPSGSLEAFLWVSRDASPRIESERRSAERLRDSAERAAEQAALRRVATAAVGDASVDAVLETAAWEAALLLAADVGLVVRFDGGRAEVVATSGAGIGPARGERIDFRRVPTLDAVARRGASARMDHAPGWQGAFRSTVAAPVRVDGRLWGGLLTATVGERRLEAGAEERLERFVEIIELAMAAAAARAQLASQALTDSLTGLPNHRAFHERLRAETSLSGRHLRPLSLAVMDIDHFKQLNDIHGHQVGDLVLTEVARRLRDTGRAGETIARIGGEEFGWILPDTDAEGALEAVERARRAVSATPVYEDVVVTISGGVTDTFDGETPEELFRFADGALYWAKASGRNTSLRYTPEATRALTAEDRARRLERSSQLRALRALARAVDAKSPATHAHAERVAHLAHRLAGALGWGADRAALLREAALLHDVGKIGVADEILLRPGPLGPADHDAVRRHPDLGADIVSDALGTEQRTWVRHHHEHWDGHGYPDRLAGDAIPEGARIIAVAEAWDAMTVARVHEAPLSPDAAMRELWRCSGTQFWPKAVEALQTLRSRSD